MENEIEKRTRELFEKNFPEKKLEVIEEKPEEKTESNETETTEKTLEKSNEEKDEKQEIQTEEKTEVKEEETTEQKEERRGRKKLPRDEHGNIIRNGEQPTQKKTTDGKGDLSDFLNQYKDEKKPDSDGKQPDKPKPQIDASKFINGAVFLMVMDAIFPFIIINLMALMDSKYDRIKPSGKKKLKLDADEKELLREGANEIVKFMFADSDPRLIFAISLFMVYFTKIDSLEKEDFEDKPHRETQQKQPKKK